MLGEVRLVSPLDGTPLVPVDGALIDGAGHRFPVTNHIPRFVRSSEYAASFGFQWRLFSKTQIESPGASDLNRARFFRCTGWQPQEFAGQAVLEVGSGAGRFSRIVLTETAAQLYSVELSDAVDVNLANNGPHERLALFQASIYALPFPPRTFDKVFCFGVLQHTPDAPGAIRCLADMVSPGGELVVDFYPLRGWWTRLHAKYLVRPLTRRMPAARLLWWVEQNTGWMLALSEFLRSAGLGRLLGRFVPVADPRPVLPPGTPSDQIREWAILDTFDMLSPAYDQPLPIVMVARSFEASGLHVSHAGFVAYAPGLEAAVVRGTRGPE